jgi:hypothetical protein
MIQIDNQGFVGQIAQPKVPFPRFGVMLWRSEACRKLCNESAEPLLYHVSCHSYQAFASATQHAIARCHKTNAPLTSDR